MNTLKHRIRPIFILLAIGATLGGTISCEEKKGPATKVGDKIDDALDRRPGEKVRDVVEDIKK